VDEADEKRSRRLVTYVTILAVPAALTITGALALPVSHRWTDTLLLLLVVLALQWFASDARSFDGHVSLVSVVFLAAYPLVGPAGAVLLSAAPLFDFGHHFSRQQKVFNASVCVLPSLAGAGVWALFGDRQVSQIQQSLGSGSHVVAVHEFGVLVLACLVTDLMRFLVNALLFAPLTVLLSGQSLPDVLRQIQRDVWRSILPAHIGYGPLGVLLALLWTVGLGPLAAVLVLAPLVSAQIAFERSAQEEDAREETLRTLIQAVETKDPYTRGHSERVARGVELLGSATGITGSRLSTLRFAGLLHDVGKLGVPTRVLTKKGSLTPEEFDEIRAHPLQGFDIITGIDFLDDARTAILHHHERLDGAGYPAGLAGKAIPEFARMIGVVDAFDSMTSSRSYHRARSVSEALAELQRCAGSHFDPAFVDAFCTTVARRGWRMTAGVSGISVNVGVAADDMSDSDAVGVTGDRPQPYDHDDPTVAPPVVLDGSR
jgi:hypothetical protein